MKLFNAVQRQGQEEVISLILDYFSENHLGEEKDDLHHEIFNTDYFLIGYGVCKEWIEKNYGVFEAIEEIKQYEQDNFGEVTTDLSNPEKVCNMFVYILGEEILYNTDAWQNYDEIDEDFVQDLELELNDL